MKNIFNGFIIILATVIVFSIYVLYVLDNLPGIIKANAAEKTPDAPLGEYINEEQSSSGQTSSAVASVAPVNEQLEEAEQEDLYEDDIWEAIDRSESYNNELQFYCKENVTFEDGKITITSKKENRGAKNYTSGLITSKFAYQYGSFSFQITIAAGQGVFPAIWLLPASGEALPEIDVFEMIGSAPLEFYGVIHYGTTSNRQREYFCNEVTQEESYEVGITWTEDELSWYIDGQCVFRTDKGVPNEPMYLIINQALGGNWAGAPDDTTAFPAVFIVESYTIEPELIVAR